MDTESDKGNIILRDFLFMNLLHDDLWKMEITNVYKVKRKTLQSELSGIYYLCKALVQALKILL